MHTTIDSATEVVSGIRFPEGNRWHDGRLWYSDMHTGEVFSPRPRDRRRAPARGDDRRAVVRARLAVGRSAGRQRHERASIVAVDADGTQSVFADLSPIESSLVNDLVVDETTGRTYVGAFGYDLYGGEELRPGPLYVVDPDGSGPARRRRPGLPEQHERAARHPDAGRQRDLGCRPLTAFDIAADGSLGGRREWAALPEGTTPDGSTVDAEGGIWVCSVDTGEFLRVVEGGTVTDRIDAPGLCAVDCALGGEDGRTLYLATADSYDPAVTARTRAGRISAVRVAVPGP